MQATAVAAVATEVLVAVEMFPCPSSGRYCTAAFGALTAFRMASAVSSQFVSGEPLDSIYTFWLRPSAIEPPLPQVLRGAAPPVASRC